KSATNGGLDDPVSDRRPRGTPGDGSRPELPRPAGRAGPAGLLRTLSPADARVAAPGSARPSEARPLPRSRRGRRSGGPRFERRDAVIAVIVSLLLVVVVVILLARTVRIVPQARAGVVERLGRYRRTLGPGLAIVVPFLDRVRDVIDLREQVVSFPPHPAITEDNLVVHIDTVIYYQVTDAKAATYEINDYVYAIEQL